MSAGNDNTPRAVDDDPRITALLSSIRSDTGLSEDQVRALFDARNVPDGCLPDDRGAAA